MSEQKFTEEQINEAYKKISILTKEAYQKIEEAEKIADEFGVDFSFGIAPGMGGCYEPKGSKISKYDYGYDPENPLRLEGKWCPSSHSC